ncbi:5-(carboxyamino)imidazole ribonucleotide synthase [Porphyrobacter sp. GA68]|uniref:5-(carboxyamino)imidazole ribonucleotide synthase n=1 Tax=Porphyrobacter sp. GA68 TaxID=2883480 RepID=UPI001D17DC40|nr:5-(carboxyamino)imidazole ribonucleotide synthase [Porphyrobacter sp. GA68]
MLAPGSTIGILGGGQLGRMLALAAAQLGHRVVTYSPEARSVAAEVSVRWFDNAWDDGPALRRFADACDVVTWEWENVPTAPLAPIADKLAAPVRALEVAQDRLAEKQFVQALGGRTAPYAAVLGDGDLARATAGIGTPGILKTCRDGYDGKGQWRINPGDRLGELGLPAVPLVYEGFVDFTAEFSVILVRGRDGEVRFWDSSHNRHVGGMLVSSTLPLDADIAQQVPAARELARQIADALDYVGVLTCEFFATGDGPLFNEMAPRVHNSGHWTAEGAATSQFENHVRAICGLPLGSTATVAERVEMRNIVGPDALDPWHWLEQPDTHLHLYGKREAREGRKMGHVTRIWRNAAP